jgi:very-short-patch-repair endonuclease
VTTDRRIVRVDPSTLQVCHAVMTDAGVRGLDPSSLHVDQLVGLVADRQDGVVLREQLEALGLGRGAIAHRRKRGLLRPLHKGVYLWGALTPTPAARARAAVLASGAESLVSHVWALSLWGLRPAVDGPVDVTVVGRRARAAGIRGHESTSLHPADIRLLRRIPVTAPARSLLDCAAELPPRALADAVEQAQIKHLVTKQDIAGAIGRAPRRPGANALRALVDQPGITRSRAERIVRSLLREARLPQPEFNAIAEGFEVDALWRRERVVLEFDSYAFHATRQAFERDRRKTAALTRNRYVVLRTTWNELTHQSHALIARTAEALALSAALRREPSSKVDRDE